MSGMDEVLQSNSYKEDFDYTLNIKPGHFQMLFRGKHLHKQQSGSGMTMAEAKAYLDEAWKKLCDRDRSNARKIFAEVYGHEYSAPAGAYVDNSKLMAENQRQSKEISDLKKRLAVAEINSAAKPVKATRTVKPKAVDEVK